MSGLNQNQPTEAQQAEPSPPGATELVRGGDGRQAETDTSAQIKAGLMAIGPVGDTATRYGVDEEQAAFLDQAAARINHRGKRHVLLMLESGRDLLGASKLFVHGQFTPWVESEFPFSVRTAQSWINAVYFADDHPDLVGKVDSTMLCKLAAPNIPLVVREGLIAEIRANKPRRTIREVELLIKEAKKSERAAPVIESDEKDFELEFDEIDAALAESGRASQELQSLLLQFIPPELIADIAQLLGAMHIGDFQKLSSRLSASQSLANPFDEGTRPST